MGKSRPKAKLSRALGITLTPKCVRYFERRPYPPGDNGRSRRKESDYSLRLREKQRLRHQYNIREKQLRRAFDKAVSMPGKSGDNLIAVLESRLDAVLLRAGFARTIYQARQLASHGHFTINGQRVTIPSHRLREYDVIEVHQSSRDKDPLLVAAQGAHTPQTMPGWLDVNTDSLRIVYLRDPQREEVPVLCDEKMVVEFYSR